MTPRFHPLLWVVLVAVTVLSCSQKTLPAYGEVLLLLSSDMPVPEGFDTVIVTVNGKGRAFRASGVPVTQDAKTAPECLVGGASTTTLSSVELKLPNTIALTSERDEPHDVSATLSACKNGGLVFTRNFKMTLPAAGQLKMLKAPIRWLCSKKLCFGCGGHSGEMVPQDCHHEAVLPLSNDELCQVSACEDSDPEVFTMVGFDDDVASRYAPEAASPPNCFDPWFCLRMTDSSQFEASAWAQLPAGWQAPPAVAGTAPICQATLDASSLDVTGTINLALVLPPGSRAYCDKIQNRCIVPLDGGSSVGWNWIDRESGSISLPDTVCHMLDSGQIQYIAAASSADCERKSPSTPLCRKRKSEEIVTPSRQLVDVATTYLSLDDAQGPAGTLLRDGSGEPTLELVGNDTLPAMAASHIAIMGAAGRFNSKRFAQGLNTDELKGVRSFSAWISLTEAATVGTFIMPILSNIADDCSSGARLELRTCGSTHGDVVVALGIPSGTATTVGCTIDYVFAPLSGKSYKGGFFTPWKTGSWFHVAAAFDAATGIRAARLYVDGARADALSSICQFDSTADEPHDGNSFYLGSAAFDDNSEELLIDEVALFPEALGPDDVQRLIIETSTISGASGLRWGAWASQGSGARVDASNLPPRFYVTDRTYASAGSYALLATKPKDVASADAVSSVPVDLSEFDEAVLVVSALPPDKEFQFSLVSNQGKRQCTWQLRSSKLTTAMVPAHVDTYVIDLRRPSWCVDPQCKFDTGSVERASLGADWESAQEKFDYAVQSLAFRKRPGSNTTSGILGGVIGPGGWCWKSVSYDAAWELERPAQMSLATQSIPVSLSAPAFVGAPIKSPELAADLPDNLGSRDFTECNTLELCVDDLGSPVPSLLYDRQLALSNASGENCSWQFPDSVGCHRVDVSLCTSGWSPGGPNPTAAEVLRDVTRLSVRYSGRVQVSSVKCCRLDGTCIGIDQVPLSHASR